jgi:hypothetical protein
VETETIMRKWSVVAMAALGFVLVQSPSVAADCRGHASDGLQESAGVPIACARGDDLGGFGRPSGEPLRLGPESSNAYDLNRDVQPRPWPESMRPHEPRDAPGVRRFPTPVPFHNNPPLRIPGTSDFPWLRQPVQPGVR